MNALSNQSKTGSRLLHVKGADISVMHAEQGDYLSLTDMVRTFEGGTALIEQWLKNKDTVLFLGIWEQLNNPSFNSLEFEGIKTEAGRNSFFLSTKKWIDSTQAVGLQARAGRYGGTFAHRDIAFEFGSWLSPEFKLYLIKEFQRLKDAEAKTESLGWSVQRVLSKVNYKIHTDAIKQNLIPPLVTRAQANSIYASEADLLNVALFGMTALTWRQANKGVRGNMRDDASVEQLVVLSNLESINAVMIRQNLPTSSRVLELNLIAREQMRALIGLSSMKPLSSQTQQLRKFESKAPSKVTNEN